MKKTILILILIGALLVEGCVREVLVPQQSSSSATCLTATMELRPDTKTSLSELTGGMYYPLWAEQDSLAVFTSAGQEPTAFSLINGIGGTTAMFEGPISGDHYVALFPYDPDARWTENTLTFRLPHAQEFQRNSFALDGFPMVAVSETGDLAFKNLCSVVRLSIKGSGVIKSITLHSDTHYLSGTAGVSLSYGDSPTLVMQEGGSHDVRLDCGAVILNNETAKDFFIVVPSATYEGLTISIDTYTETVTKAISHEVTLNRSELRPVTPFMVEVPMIDLDHLPDNQIWYKTNEGKTCTFLKNLIGEPFDAEIVSHTYEDGYGIIIFDAPVKVLNQNAFVLPYGISETLYKSVYVTYQELHLPDCVETISWEAIPELPSFRIPGSLKVIKARNLDKLGSIYGPLVAADGRSVVNDHVLLGIRAAGLEEYTTPDGVYTIGEESLSSNNLKTVRLSEGVRSIQNYGLNSLQVDELFLPSSIESIGSIQSGLVVRRGFYGSSHCTSSDHMCLIDPRTKALDGLVIEGDAEVFTIPEGVVYFNAQFVRWPNLRKIIVPSSLSFVSNRIFADSPEFEGFEGPIATSDGRGLINNGNLIYYYGGGLKDCVLPSEAKSICSVHDAGAETITVSEGTKCLRITSLNCPGVRTIKLPTTITEIDQWVFSGATNLESIYLPVRVPPTVWGEPSYQTLPKMKVYVPEEAFQDYMSDPGWRGGWEQHLTPYHFDNIDPPAAYESSDYSQDGKVTVLQTATEGNGIDLILMGRDYSDRLIENGTYLSVMEAAMNAFFEPEPYHSFRHLFNVYAVNVVSPHEEGYPLINGDYFAYLRAIDQGKYLEYALKAVPDDRIDEATIIVLHHADCVISEMGLCSNIVRASTPNTDYGSGIGFAIYAYSTFGVHGLTWHEAGGHGFGKLYDEYDASDGSVISEIAKANLQDSQKKGYNLNIDFTPDPTKVRWAHFLSDSRYENERLGVFEGAYFKGVYRPSENSIMTDTKGGYNAPSREAIYYRIHKLAFGSDWEYDYEKFVEYDQGAKNIRPTSLERTGQAAKTYEVRDPLPVTNFNPDEWTITTMQ